jgi:plastocyanin
MSTDIKGPLTLLIVLIGIIVIGYLWFILVGAPATPSGETVGEKFVPGPPSSEVLAQLEKSRGFEVLISYTDNGFEPSEATIRQGESVRFTNNSSYELWVAAEGADGAPLYPGTSECGGSPLDSCKVLKPRDFWEFTFVASGSWLFKNNLDKEKSGVVRVEVR